MKNYFDFFSLPPSPTLDRGTLKKQFYANSRAFHPDFHTLADDEARDEALEKSTLNNQAYKTLINEDTRLKHLLELRGALGPEGSNQVPQDFLMEIMEVNEALMELEFDNDPAAKLKVTALIEQLEAGLSDEVGDLLTGYDDATANRSRTRIPTRFLP